MNRIIIAGTLCAAFALHAAETVNAYSAAFSFPLSTANVRTGAPKTAQSALSCRNAGIVVWNVAVKGSTLRIISLDGAVVRTMPLKASQGCIDLRSVRIGAGIYRAVLTSKEMDRTITIMVP